MQCDEKSLALDGEWRFVWGELVDPNDVQWKNAKVLPVPSVWTGKLWDGKILPLAGYGTYQLEVFLPPKTSRLGINLGQIGTAYTLFVNNEILLRCGTPGTVRETTIPNYRPQTIYFLPSGQKITLTLQTANFHDRMSGIWTQIRIGDATSISQKAYIDSGMDMLLIGVFLIIGLYYLISWYFGGRNGAFLWFGLCCLSIGLRTMSAGQIFFMVVFPWFDFEVNYKIQFMSQIAIVMCFLNSLRHLFPEQIKSIFLRICAWLMLFYAIVILVTPLILHSKVLPYFHIFLFGLMMVILFAVATAIRRSNKIAVIVGFGLLVFCSTVINDVLFSNGLIQTSYLVPYGLVFFSVSYIIALTSSASAQIQTTGIVLNAMMIENLKNQGVSNRECDVISCLVKGMDYKTIGESLFISKSTVTKHIHSVYHKLKVKNRVQLYDYLSQKDKMV